MAHEDLYEGFLELFHKHDPLGVDSPSKDEYSFEVSQLIEHMNIFSKSTLFEVFHNLVYSALVEGMCTAIDCSGNITIFPIEHVEKYIGKKENHQKLAEECFSLIKD
jgi:hypothetical protein